VVANAGALPQRAALEELHARFAKAFGERPHPLVFSHGHPIGGSNLASLKGNLLSLLERADLREGIERMGQYLDDLSRYRVLRLTPEAFTEYAEIMGRHLARSGPGKTSGPSRVSRFLFRGFLFATLAVKLRLESQERRWLRARNLSLLLHVHGLGRGPERTNLRLLGKARVFLQDPELRGLVRHYLRSSVEGLGTRWPSIVEEIGLKVSVLNAGLLLASLAAAEAGRTRADAADFGQGLTTAADLVHAGDQGLLPRLLGMLSGDALHLLSSGRYLGREVVVYDSGVAAEA
jgi:hypothetical protein